MPKRDCWLAVSLTANAGLLCAGWFLLNQVLKLQSPAIQVTNRQVSARKLGSSHSTNRDAAGFSWSQLESEDYPVYIANLRAVGCPEETIRDIVMAEINKLYAQKYSALVGREGQDYWEWPRPGMAPAYDQQRDLFQEKRALVKELLGIDLLVENQRDDPGLKATQKRLGFLPEPKRQKFLDLEEKYCELEHQVYAHSHGLTTREDQAALALLEQQKSAEIAGLLTAQEQLELAMRTSPTAQRLRMQLAAFQPTEAEFRGIYEARGAFENKLNSGPNQIVEVGATHDDSAAAEVEFQERLRATLGDQRYAEYQRANDADYQNLMRIADRYGLGGDVANQVFSLKQNAAAQSRQLQANAQLTPEDRQAALGALQAQAEATLTALMGQQALAVYRDRGGSWIEQLGR